MGPPDRLEFDCLPGIMLGVTVRNFPYQYYVTFYLLFFAVHIGLGRDYTQPKKIK